MITNSFKSHSQTQKFGLNSLTIHDFVNQQCQDYPALIDYLGFYEEGMEIEQDPSRKLLYEHHLELEELTKGVKSGEFLQGKVNTDRTNPEEGFYFL